MASGAGVAVAILFVGTYDAPVIAVEQQYRYRAASSYDPKRSLLDLATSGGRTDAGAVDNPRLFAGSFTFPAVAAEGLRAVARVAATRYADLTQRSYRDPVVTSDGQRLRFEAFSACGGVYARLDVLPDGLDGDLPERGTTNVDINEPLRRLLAGVSPTGQLHVSVGPDDLTMSDGRTTLAERRVPLPPRWVRGFAESQQLASAFDARVELSAAEAARFLRSAVKARTSGWVLPAGRTVRLSGRPSSQAVFLAEARRLEALLPLLRFATSVRGYGPVVTDDLTEASSGWEVELHGARLVLLLSPSTWRGFSGEGAQLEHLASDDALDDADLLRSAVAFQPDLDVDDLADTVGLPVQRVRIALACLAAAGQVGYDLNAAAYFHRELPYAATAIEAMNPRLRAARDLVAAGSVQVVNLDIAEVTSGENRYRVRRTATGVNCTCAWWTSHRGGRGPCKHVLATQIVRDGAQGRDSQDVIEPAGVVDDPTPHRGP